MTTKRQKKTTKRYKITKIRYKITTKRCKNTNKNANKNKQKKTKNMKNRRKYNTTTKGHKGLKIDKKNDEDKELLKRFRTQVHYLWLFCVSFSLAHM